MIVGATNQFAIESEIETVTEDGWILGHFRFWVRAQAIGDWEDTADLKGIASWLQDFTTSNLNRYELQLTNVSKKDAFRLLFDPVIGMPNNKASLSSSEQFEQTYIRFHISHVGMSAFDKYDLLLIEMPQYQRLVWRAATDTIIHDMSFPAQTMQRVAEQYCHQFKQLITKYPSKKSDS